MEGGSEGTISRDAFLQLCQELSDCNMGQESEENCAKNNGGDLGAATGPEVMVIDHGGEEEEEEELLAMDDGAGMDSEEMFAQDGELEQSMDASLALGNFTEDEIKGRDDDLGGMIIPDWCVVGRPATAGPTPTGPGGGSGSSRPPLIAKEPMRGEGAAVGRCLVTGGGGVEDREEILAADGEVETGNIGCYNDDDDDKEMMMMNTKGSNSAATETLLVTPLSPAGA